MDPTLPEELGDVLQVGGDVFEVGRAAGDAVPVRAGVARPEDKVCTGFITQLIVTDLDSVFSSLYGKVVQNLAVGRNQRKIIRIQIK